MPNHHLLTRAGLAFHLVALGACGRPSEAERDASAAADVTPASVPTERGEKLGVPFVRIGAPSGPDAYWIAATPLPCSAGEHALVECPLTTALVDAPAGGPALGSRTALVTDAVTAYRICALRFAGRLPTPDERRDLGRLQGLATIIASTTPEGALRVEALDEWTAQGDCTNPSKPGADCRFERFPGGATPAADAWASMQACEASPAPASARAEDAISIGATCARGADCLVQSPWFPSPEATPRLHQLRCRPPATPPPHPPARPDVAAFRCILPQHALTVTPAP